MQSFIGLGAQKSASTWLYDILADHPDVAVSPKKEVDFFSRYYDFGTQWYTRQFPQIDGQTCRGEISPSYLTDEGAAKRAHNLLPDARLLVVLRNPVDRALSNHRHDVRIGLFGGSDLSFEAGLQNNPEYVNQGFYARHLDQWLEHYPQDQLLVLLVDDIRKDAQATAKRLYAHLNLAADHDSQALHKRSNESYVNRHKGLESGKNAVRGAIRKVGLGAAWEKFGDAGVRKLYRKFNQAPSSSVIPDPDESTLARLREAFLPDIEALERNFGFDLTHWKA